jgi:hypothetical protein
LTRITRIFTNQTTTNRFRPAVISVIPFVAVREIRVKILIREIRAIVVSFSVRSA